MIKTIVFDIGRVLIGFEWEDYTSRIFAGRLTDEEIDIVNKATFRSSYWNEQDLGIMDIEDIHAHMLSLAPGYEDYAREALDRVGECVVRQDYAIPWLKEIRALGYQVLYLSNLSEFAYGASYQAYDFLPYMDGGIMSWIVNYIKPDERIYKTLFERYNLNPNECVFIDDNPVNIQVGRELGMKTVLFENYEQAHEELMKIIED